MAKALASWMTKVHWRLVCSKGVCLCMPSKIQVFVNRLLFYTPPATQLKGDREKQNCRKEPERSCN